MPRSYVQNGCLSGQACVHFKWLAIYFGIDLGVKRQLRAKHSKVEVESIGVGGCSLSWDAEISWERCNCPVTKADGFFLVAVV